MSPIPFNLRIQLAKDPYYAKCARAEDGGCNGRITWEHAILYAGRQVQERWAIIPLCYRHHLGDLLDKTKNVILATNRATDDDKKKYPRLNWQKHGATN